jgi:hypothetical protein
MQVQTQGDGDEGERYGEAEGLAAADVSAAADAADDESLAAADDDEALAAADEGLASDDGAADHAEADDDEAEAALDESIDEWRRDEEGYNPFYRAPVTGVQYHFVYMHPAAGGRGRRAPRRALRALGPPRVRRGRQRARAPPSAC